jgi:hypothetical protein
MPTDADVLQGYRGPFDHGYIFAERLSSATNVLGAERAARSTIRDKHVRSL